MRALLDAHLPSSDQLAAAAHVCPHGHGPHGWSVHYGETLPREQIGKLFEMVSEPPHCPATTLTDLEHIQCDGLPPCEHHGQLHPLQLKPDVFRTFLAELSDMPYQPYRDLWFACWIVSQVHGGQPGDVLKCLVTHTAGGQPKRVLSLDDLSNSSAVRGKPQGRQRAGSEVRSTAGFLQWVQAMVGDSSSGAGSTLRIRGGNSSMASGQAAGRTVAPATAQEEEVDVIVLAFIKVSLDEPFATRHADTLCRMPLVQRAL